MNDAFTKFAAVIFSVLILVPLLWWSLDRDPPYERVFGTIMPEDPEPGDFIQVIWNIKAHRRCTPSPRRNITRRVVDATGKYHDYEPVEGVFGSDDDAPLPGEILARSFQLPLFIAPGPAIYKSTATFSCNPISNIWPIVVDKPEIRFIIRPKAENIVRP